MAGSRFVRADLHVHTILGPGEAAPASAPTVEAAIEAATASGISVIAITDHNTIANCRRAVELATPELLVLPAVEITTAEGHIVALFPPDGFARLEGLMQTDVLRLRTIDASGAQRSRRSMAELASEISSRGGLAIAAHVDTADGLLTRANPAALSDLLAEPGLAGFEITRSANSTIFSAADPDVVRKQLWSERRKALGVHAQLARIMSSDAHSPELIGADTEHRTLTRLRLDELNFEGVVAAIRFHPDARCKLEANLAVHYPRLVSARFEGGFLDGVEVEFSPNLNCLIGGRGSGKSTILDALRGVLNGQVPPEVDDQGNMPDYTEVEFIDELGARQRAGRKRHEDTFDVDAPDHSLTLDITELEQDFGSELIDDDPANPSATHAFLRRFMSEHIAAAADLDCMTRLQTNAETVKRTSGARKHLETLREQKRQLDRKLSTATGANLTKVAEYARLLAAEAPLLAELARLIDALPTAELPTVPDLPAIAGRFGVDLSTSPSAKLALGPGGLEGSLKNLARRIVASQAVTQAQIRQWIAPAKAKLSRWERQHEHWEAQIEDRKKLLEAAGLSLQIRELERVRSDLRSTSESIRTYELWERQYREAVAQRRDLLAELRAVRDDRHATRKASTNALTQAMNQAAAGASSVSVVWNREGLRSGYATRLGQLFDLHSPRKERLAAAVSPARLAEIAWTNDIAALQAVGSPEQFFPDPRVAMKVLRTFNVLFEFETMDLDDRPDIAVRFRGDPRGRGRPLRDLSLGQLRSVLLGFILASRGSSPMILDQPEEQLDGPFIADTVVGHLHAVKESRQLIVATHNPNIVVLGDAELVLPLQAERGRSRVVHQGSVDTTRTRSQIVRLLEGGLLAFQQRARRYGLAPP